MDDNTENCDTRTEDSIGFDVLKDTNHVWTNDDDITDYQCQTLSGIRLYKRPYLVRQLET